MSRRPAPVDCLDWATTRRRDSATTRAIRIRTFRLIIVLAQELRTLMDQRLRQDGLTTQQAALITVVDMAGAPSLSEAATFLGSTHQNVKQIAASLERKGFLRIVLDEHDGRVRRLETTAKSRRTWKRRSDADQRVVLDWFSSPRARRGTHALLVAPQTGDPTPRGPCHDSRLVTLCHLQALDFQPVNVR